MESAQAAHAELQRKLRALEAERVEVARAKAEALQERSEAKRSAEVAKGLEMRWGYF